MCRFLVGFVFVTGSCCLIAVDFLDFSRDPGLGFFCFRSTRTLEMYLPVVEVFPLRV